MHERHTSVSFSLFRSDCPLHFQFSFFFLKMTKHEPRGLGSSYKPFLFWPQRRFLFGSVLKWYKSQHRMFITHFTHKKSTKNGQKLTRTQCNKLGHPEGSLLRKRKRISGLTSKGSQRTHSPSCPPVLLRGAGGGVFALPSPSSHPKAYFFLYTISATPRCNLLAAVGCKAPCFHPELALYVGQSEVCSNNFIFCFALTCVSLTMTDSSSS